MVYKTYISKSNTIVCNSPLNTSLNPVSSLIYGRKNEYSRFLLWFDHTKIKDMYENGVMPDMDKMSHRLHITNAGSLDFTQLHDCGVSEITDYDKYRAMSFDLIFFLIPKEWDEGRGFDYKKSFYNKGFYGKFNVDKDRLISDEACNWFQRRNFLPWDEPGIYSVDTLSGEYDKFSSGDTSAKVIGRLKFQVGNEDIDIDITDVVNKFITGELDNYGIGIAYSPMYELSDIEKENYLALITDKTNLWYAPYVETRYCDAISDDRGRFVSGKDNRLYLYCTIGDGLDDLDRNPLVSIWDTNTNCIQNNIESKKFSKGIYYIDLNMPGNPGDMYYDIWQNLQYNGNKLPDVELDFTIKSPSTYFMIGNSIQDEQTFTPSISGIQEKEQIFRGDIRKIVISARPNYTKNVVQLLDSMDIRLYVKDGMAEIDCISWDKVNKTSNENFYMLDTSMLIPNRYFIDVRIRYGMSSIIHHDVLTFDIVEDKTNKYA